MIADQYLIVRTASLYITIVLTAAIWFWRRPDKRVVSGAVLAFVWNLPAILVLHVVGTKFGWWQFDARGGLLLGIPVDLYLEWAWLWGAIPAIAFPALSLAPIVFFVLAMDLLLMPNAAPVLRLGPAWLAGDLIGFCIALLPAQLLARWTSRDLHLEKRALLQVLAFSGVLFFVLPVVIIEASRSYWKNPLEWPVWQLSLWMQLLVIPALTGLTAVQEFVARGIGTPVPFDPPRRLVTTGVYSYIANPMQSSAVLLLVFLGCILQNLWVASAGLMAHIYSTGLAGWDEDKDLQDRFGNDWVQYRRNVRRWVPRLRPWRRPDLAPAFLFVSETCNMCRDVARWFEKRGARHLVIVAAESHPSGALRRITYEPGDGTRSSSGVEAVAHALEHIHLGWALLGFFLRLPIVREFAQLLADASGAEPRTISTFSASSSEK